MRAALGIDVGGTKIRTGLVREDGEVVKIAEIATEAEQGGSHVVSSIEGLIKAYVGQGIAGVGIGTAGQVGWDGSILSATSTFPGWSGTHLQELLADRTRLPVKVVNDVQAMALGELYFGEGRGLRHLLCLALGTGVGGAIICDGKLFRGASGVAGEMGHMAIHPRGRTCPCGKKGCLEAYVSGTALSERYEERTGVKRSATGIMQDAGGGEVAASELMEEFLDDLSGGISSLVAIFNPEKIVLGGGLTEGLASYLPRLTSKVREELNPAMAPYFTLSVSKLGGNAMILGAASLILKGGNFK